jgi:hypothetical protein
MKYVFVQSGVFAMFALLVVGCGPSQRLGNVSGTVTYQGEPIKNGAIVFEVPGARPATGKIVDGQITEVTTFEKGDGVPVGMANISVTATDAPEGSAAPGPNSTDPGTQTDMSNYMGMGAESIIPPHYNDPASSGLSWDIKAGDNTLTLDLKE